MLPLLSPLDQPASLTCVLWQQVYQCHLKHLSISVQSESWIIFWLFDLCGTDRVTLQTVVKTWTSCRDITKASSNLNWCICLIKRTEVLFLLRSSTLCSRNVNRIKHQLAFFKGTVHCKIKIQSLFLHPHTDRKSSFFHKTYQELYSLA